MEAGGSHTGSFPVTGHCLMSTQGLGEIALHVPPPTCNHGLTPLQPRWHLLPAPGSASPVRLCSVPSCPAHLLLQETRAERGKAGVSSIKLLTVGEYSWACWEQAGDRQHRVTSVVGCPRVLGRATACLPSSPARPRLGQGTQQLPEQLAQSGHFSLILIF